MSEPCPRRPAFETLNQMRPLPPSYTQIPGPQKLLENTSLVLLIYLWGSLAACTINTTPQHKPKAKGFPTSFLALLSPSLHTLSMHLAYTSIH